MDRYKEKKYLDKAPQGATKYNTTLEQYDKYVGAVSKDRDKWRIISFVLVGIVGVMVILFIYAINQPETVPMVITVQPSGQAEYVGDISNYSYNDIRVPEVSIRYHLWDFINLRNSLYLDNQIVVDNWTTAFSFTTNRTFGMLENEWYERLPEMQDTQVMRRCEKETLINVTDSSYQVDWVEVTFNSSGEVVKRERWRGIYTIYLGNAEDHANMEPAEREINPLLIFIDDYEETLVGEL